jgi:hypothetical protein
VSLGEVLIPFSHVRLAREDEGAALSAFARSKLMALKTADIGFDRGADFFSLFRVYARRYWVFAILNDDGSVAGVASLTRFRAMVRGQPKWVGYFGDLRLCPNASREARVQWRDAYSAIVRYVEEPSSPDHCEHLITAVLQENIRALQLFQNRLKTVKYHDLCPYWTLSVFHHGHPGFSWGTRSGFEVEDTDNEAIQALKRPSLSLAELPSGSSFQALLARDRRGEPACGALLWDARSARTLRVADLPRQLRLGFRLLSAISPLRYSESESWIMKCLSCPSARESLSSEEHRDALSALIRHCFRRSRRDFHFLNLTLMNAELAVALQKRHPISRLTAGRLFEISSSERGPSLTTEKLFFEGAFL